MTTFFTQLPQMAESHLRLWVYAAIAQVTAYLYAVGGDEIMEQFGFLHGYLAEIQHYLPDATFQELHTQWLTQLLAWEETLPDESQAWPLRRLQAAGLASNHLLALMLAGLVDVDARIGRLFAMLHPMPDEQRLTIGLLNDILQAHTSLSHLGTKALPQTLHAAGLITIYHPEKPRAAQALSIPGVIWDAVTGQYASQLAPHLTLYDQLQFRPIDALIDSFPESLITRVRRLPDLIQQQLISGVILRGMEGSGRLRVVGAMARAMKQSVLLIDCPQITMLPDLCQLAGPLATLLGAIPAVKMELAPGETVDMAQLPGYSGAIAVLLRQEGSMQGTLVESCVTLQIPLTSRAIRQHYWKQNLQSATSDMIDSRTLAQISNRFHLTIGTIEKAAPLTKAYAVLDGRTQIELKDAQAACRSLNRQSLDALATHLDVNGFTWESLIVPEHTRIELENLVLRCRQRESVLPYLGKGFGGHNRGVRALFGGPSGTGKTLAARVLVAELGLDLYRVDLAAVVNKYIGETERNLSRLFARAEEQDVVLLLDEGDSLLTGRTDVRSSNDRYANMETNYLLQRLEQYEGIILITTNAPNRIDNAFQRRIDVVLDFTLPDTDERYGIWLLHLPETHMLEEDYLRMIASRCQLNGGQIRNAALHATMLSVEHHSSITAEFVVEAIAREYYKIGASAPLLPV